jgi:hypothetical protein
MGTRALQPGIRLSHSGVRCTDFGVQIRDTGLFDTTLLCNVDLPVDPSGHEGVEIRIVSSATGDCVARWMS